MAQSISQAQSQFLSSGKISGLGSDREADFVPAESEKALFKVAEILIVNARNNLQQSSQISSGELSDSFKVIDPQTNGKVIKLDVEALDYFDFQNKGVRGISGGSSTGGYAFKNAFPSKDMVKSITGWLARAGASTRNVKKPASKLESKNKSIAEFQVAYAVAQSIKVHGIKGTGYFDKAIKLAENYAEDILGQALAIDIINTLPNKLGNVNSNKQ